MAYFLHAKMKGRRGQNGAFDYAVKCENQRKKRGFRFTLIGVEAALVRNPERRGAFLAILGKGRSKSRLVSM